MGIPRYGMKHRTIKYWQGQAENLWRYAGVKYAGPFRLNSGSRLQNETAQYIGHQAIMAAVIRTPTEIYRLFTYGYSNNSEPL